MPSRYIVIYRLRQSNVEKKKFRAVIRGDSLLSCAKEDMKTRHLAFSISLIFQVRQLRCPEFPGFLKVLGAAELGPWDKFTASFLPQRKTCLGLTLGDTIK